MKKYSNFIIVFGSNFGKRTLINAINCLSRDNLCNKEIFDIESFCVSWIVSFLPSLWIKHLNYAKNVIIN